jgi:hypothetical protein
LPGKIVLIGRSFCQKNQLQKIFLLLAVHFSWACCSKINAQLNRGDTLDWQIKFTVNGSLLAGNVSRFILMNKLELAFAQPLWGMSSRNEYQFGTAARRKTENDFISYNFLYLYPLRKVYPYMMALVETNYRKRIRFRYQLGPGVSYSLLAEKNSLVRLSMTGTYEHTRFDGTQFSNLRDTQSNIIKVCRITGRLFTRHHLFEGRMKIIAEFWWQQSVSDARNHRFYNEEVVEFPVSEHISFRTGFRYTYENVRLKELKPHDLFWTFGFSISNF